MDFLVEDLGEDPNFMPHIAELATEVRGIAFSASLAEGALAANNRQFHKREIDPSRGQGREERSMGKSVAFIAIAA